MDASTEHILKGAPVAAALNDDLSARVGTLKEKGVYPTLAIVRVGNREDDLAYERGAIKRAEALGIRVDRFELPESATQTELEQVIARINEDDSISGCLLLRPLPAHMDEARICAMLSPEKDSDGITPGSLYGVFSGQPEGYAPCTPAAVIELLDYYDVPLEGADVVVVGRSLVVGRPLAMLLQQRNATVTMCHTRTRDLDEVCSKADILIAAAGAPRCLGAEHANEGQVVVDVGINWDEDAQRLVGDVDFEEVEPKVSAITPVPGGIGAVTTAVLMKHVVEAAERASERAS